jgi:hypothetical protein
MHVRFVFALLSVVLLASCATMRPADFADGGPRLAPETFFVGRTRSFGVVEARSGRPWKRITTQTTGVMKAGVLYIEQDLQSEDSKPSHRSWQIRTVDAHHADATANDIAGTAHGTYYGNTLMWSFTLKRKPGNPLQNVRMSQAMYLAPDGQTLIIRSIIRKFGIIVAEVTEQFRKE